MKQSLGPRTLIYPAPVLIVGTYDTAGKANGMAAAWGGICCSRPPCVYVSLRKATYTYDSILAHGCYTISIPSEEYVREADYMGLASGRDEDKFARTGLTPVKSDLVDAPYVLEFPIALECRLLQHIELGLHTQFIGEVLDVKADLSVLNEEGMPDMALVKPILVAPESCEYYGVGQLLGKAFSVGRALLSR